jgi:hypothetical protein
MVKMKNRKKVERLMREVKHFLRTRSSKGKRLPYLSRYRVL